jgi:hypothetical protein
MSAIRVSGLILLSWIGAGCGRGGGGAGTGCELGFFCCPTCPAFVPKTCAELRASQFFWNLNGFASRDILNPDTRDQPELTAIVHVGDAKVLKVSAGSTDTSEDCSGKATTVDWSVSSPVVVRLEVQGNPRVATLVALQPGDTNVSAVLQFEDGTPTMRVLPWSFTNVGSGNITVIRVVP